MNRSSNTVGRFRDLQQHRLFLLLLLATSLNAFLVLARLYWVHQKTHPADPYSWPEIQGIFGLAFGFLGWNLLLAWIPYLAALRIDRQERAGAPWSARWFWIVLWLAFLPNAPYIITDFIHLQYRPPVPIWYDMVMLFAFASTGLMLGLLSMFEVRNTLRQHVTIWQTEGFMLLAIGMSGFGVWLGRFQRWNSWDILANPLGLVRDLAHTMARRHELIDALGVSGLVGGMLLVGYAMLTIMLSGGKEA